MPSIRHDQDAIVSLITNGPTLADGARYATDLTSGEFEDANNDDWVLAYCWFEQITFGSAPVAGQRILEVYTLHGTLEGPSVYASGGDGTTGDDETPQATLLSGVIETRLPSTTEDERLEMMMEVWPEVRLVLENVSGQSINSGWDLRAIPRSIQSVT